MPGYREVAKKMAFGGMAVSGLVMIPGGLAAKVRTELEWVLWASGGTWACFLCLFMALAIKNLHIYSIDVSACIFCAIVNLATLNWIFHLDPGLLWTYIPICVDIGILEVVGLKFMGRMDADEVREYGYIQAFLLAFVPRGVLPQ